jgi:hypothetical protein
MINDPVRKSPELMINGPVRKSPEPSHRGVREPVSYSWIPVRAGINTFFAYLSGLNFKYEEPV